MRIFSGPWEPRAAFPDGDGVVAREGSIRTQRRKRCGLRPGYAEAPAVVCDGFRVHGRIRQRTVPGSFVRSYFPLRSVSDSEAAVSSAPAATTPGQPKCAHAAPERNVPSVPPAK